MQEVSYDRKIKYDRSGLSDALLLELYYKMLTPRLIEERMLLELRSGTVSKWFSGIGQEAIAVGSTMAMLPDEHIFTMHRNLGVFTTRNVPLLRLFAQWQGKEKGFTQGRDRSFHFGAPQYHIIGMISHLGAQLSVADGVGLAYKLRQNQKATLAFTGEGGTSEGEFHEALNTAAVWELPVIFLVENNGYGLSTPSSDQFKCVDIADKGQGYGMKSTTIDGNNILEVYKTVRSLAEEARHQSTPVLLECKTFRRRGHEEASGVKYVPKELIAHWEARDPIANYEAFLIEEGLLDPQEAEAHKARMKNEIKDAWKEAGALPPLESSRQKELNEVFQANHFIPHPPSSSQREMRFVEAIKDGLDASMQRYDNLILMGQDIAEYGGVFKVTEGFVERYGKDRVRNTPLCESAILGAALGLSIEGFKSMVEMQFADFVTVGFNQIVNNLAKVHYRWGQPADVVVRMPSGGGMSAGPFHSQTNEAWFANVSGLKLVYPSTPEDAKGLLITAIEDPNPVMFFEHKGLYRSIKSMVPEGYYNLPFGQARWAREGDALTIVTYGMGVHWALTALEELGVSADVLDLRTLVPLDKNAIRQSIMKTGRVLILHEDSTFAGYGAELGALIAEEMFELLDAPVMRVGSMDTPIPFNDRLEQQYMANSLLTERIKQLLAY